MSPTEKQSLFAKISATIIGPKREWRAYQRRINALPAPYRDATRAFERYLNYEGGISATGAYLAMFGDLADLMEGTAADGTPVRAIFGDDPLAFAENFVANYTNGHWAAKERARFVAAIDAAATLEPPRK